MARAKMPLNQLEIPAPPSPNARAGLTDEDRERIYAEEVGREALERQRALAAAETTCTCDVGAQERRAKFHKPRCKLHPLRFGRRRT